MHPRHRLTVSALATVIACGAPARPAAAEIPPHPDQIIFPELVFEPPPAAEFRYTIDTSAGPVPVYMAPSHEFPLINVTFTFRGGADLDPADKIGLARTTGAMMRRGGTTSVSPE